MRLFFFVCAFFFCARQWRLRSSCPRSACRHLCVCVCVCVQSHSACMRACCRQSWLELLTYTHTRVLACTRTHTYTHYTPTYAFSRAHAHTHTHTHACRRPCRTGAVQNRVAHRTEPSKALKKPFFSCFFFCSA